MEHKFDVDIAVEYGMAAAVLLDHIHFWLIKNKVNGRNYFDGFYWTYNSRKAFTEIFPYLSERQIKTAMDKLIADDIIKVGRYNTEPWDRTMWYALTEKGWCIVQKCQSGIAKMSDPNSGNVRPIPDIDTDSIPDKDTQYDNTSYSHTSYSPSTHRKRDNWTPQRFDDFWSIYPRHVNKTTAMRAWAKLKADDSLTDTILKDVKRRLDGEWKDADIQFIPHPSTYLNQRRWEDESPSEKPASPKPKYTRPRGEYGPSDGDYWNGMDRGQYYAAKTIEHLDDGTEIWVFPDGRKYNTVTREFYFND